MQTLRNLRRRNTNHAAMPSLTRNHRDVTIRRIFQLRDRKIDDLLLHCLAFLITSVEMIREPARFIGVARIKELNHGTGRVHASGGVNSWPKPEPEIVCCHARAVSATGY